MLRRSFIKGILTPLLYGLVAMLPYALARLIAPVVANQNPILPGRRRLKLRPPGALQSEKAFTEACIGCGLCGEVCPPRCIKFHQREGGGQVNTPYIVAEEKGCILCGKCMEVCPTEALTPTDRYQVNMGIAQIDQGACYPWVDRGVCGACVAICPLGERAIDFDFANIYRPVIQQGCVGCGVCVEICPHPSVPIRIVQQFQSTITAHRI
ncbi:MAG: 4Fe-4S dicluster domain-containing protein [Motiliproteus sp.]